MPVWHEKTRQLVADGELMLVGIVQEQHPDRTELFAQWKEFDFPILWDPFGYAGLDVVPLVSAIDEHGVVRMSRPNPRKFDDFMSEFIERSFEAPAGGNSAAVGFHVTQASLSSEGPASAVAARRAAARLLLSREGLGGKGAPTIDADVAALEAHASATGAPADRFRAGVARRMRHDGPSARADDFQVAIDNWRAALAAQPNQYIWRRRIQQWGPRLDKPYAFYDWVAGAQDAIAARGETPIEVLIPLSGSEIADRSRAIPRATEDADPPDPKGLITRDAGRLVRVETAVALHTGSVGPRSRTPRGASRVHVTLRPHAGAKWAPDADPAQLWIDVPHEWSLARSLVTFPAAVLGGEARPLRVDFEASTPPVPLVPPPPGGPPPPAEAVLRGYVVYSICLDDGTCVFRRQDVEIVIPLPAAGGPDDDSDDDR